MSKIIALLLVAMSTLSLCACGNSNTSDKSNTSSETVQKQENTKKPEGTNNKDIVEEQGYAIITNNEGETEKLTHDELKALHENAIAFDKKYVGARISVIDTVYSINNNVYAYMSLNNTFSWEVLVSENDDIVSKLNKGDVVKVTGIIKEFKIHHVVIDNATIEKL